MTQARDQDSAGLPLSKHAQRMLALRDEVLLEWEKRLRAAVPEARDLPHPIIINTFPALYDNLAQAISPDYPRVNAGRSNTVASEHGGERARLTDYNIQGVISEYQLLRSALFDLFCQDGSKLDPEEIDIINTSFDDAIRESVTAFAFIQSALRERAVAGLINELRVPLQTANVATGILHSLVESAKIRDLATLLNDNLGRLETMIQDVLATLVFQAGERLRLNLTTWDMLWLIKEVTDRFRLGHGPRFQLLGESVTGYWDREAVCKAVEHLLENAVAYSAPRSLVRIHIEALHERMILSIHNHGRPIPPEQLESVFQVYRRALAARAGDTEGWGVGLPFVRNMAESHGGSFGIESQIDRGTTYVIDMPVDSRPYADAPTIGTDRY